MKREGYISWDEFGMSVALIAAQRSKDPSTQVGACILNFENRVVGVGYNGFPNGCSDDVLPWERGKDFIDSKYSYVIHAEENSILNASNKSDLVDGIMYVTLAPCNKCAQSIIQSGIKEVCYLSDKYHDQDFSIVARRLMDLAGIKYRKFESLRKDLTINFVEEKND